MIARDLADILDARFAQEAGGDRSVTSGYTSDLLSDVLAHAADGAVLITIQAHKNTVAVASLVGISAVVICNGRPIPRDMIEAARDESIPMLVTDATQFETSGRLFQAIQG